MASIPTGRQTLSLLRARPENAMYVGSLASTERKLILKNSTNAVYSPPGFLHFQGNGNLMAQPFDAQRLELAGAPMSIADEFIPGELNREISASKPSEYFKRFKEENYQFDEVLDTHLIPHTADSGIWNDDYEKFIDARIGLIFRELKRVAGSQPEGYASTLPRKSFRAFIQKSKEAIMSTAPRPQPISADPVKVDPKHYTVESENDRVRVLRVKYGPHEKSVMHGHPAVVAVFLTENNGRFTLPDGRTEERSWKAGESMVMPAEEHLPENLSDNPLELVLIELK